MNAILGKALGIDQAKAIADLKAAIVPAVKELLGGMTIPEYFEKFGDDKQVRFSVDKLEGRIWLEDKPK